MRLIELTPSMLVNADTITRIEFHWGEIRTSESMENGGVESEAVGHTLEMTLHFSDGHKMHAQADKVNEWLAKLSIQPPNPPLQSGPAHYMQQLPREKSGADSPQALG